MSRPREEILICLHCGAVAGENPRTIPARTLRRKIRNLLKEKDESFDLRRVRGVTCIGFCANREVVAFQGPERETLVFGDIEADKDESELVAAFLQYCDTPPRHRMARDERPPSLRDRLLARIPALKSPDG